MYQYLFLVKDAVTISENYSTINGKEIIKYIDYSNDH